MAPYSRNPGPWKRYADAAGGNADAGALLDQILLRFRTGDALRERWGARWIVQSMRCWRQEVPLSEKRLERAIKRLKKADLIEVKIAPLEHSPTPYTHIRLTAHGEEFLKGTGRKAKSPDRSNRSRQIDRDDSVISAESTRPTGCQNSLLNTPPEMEDSEISLAPDGARDREFLSQRKGSRKEEDSSRDPTNDRDVTASDFGEVWRDAHRQYRPELPCSPLFASGFRFANRIAQALGGDLEEVVHAVVKDWSNFRSYVLNARGAMTCSVDPDFAALAIHIDAAQIWFGKQQELEQHEREEQQQARLREIEREKEEATAREARRQRAREEYRRLSEEAPRLRQQLAEAPTLLEEYLAGTREREKIAHRRERAEGFLRADFETYVHNLESQLARLTELETEFGGNRQPTDEAHLPVPASNAAD